MFVASSRHTKRCSTPPGLPSPSPRAFLRSIAPQTSYSDHINLMEGPSPRLQALADRIKRAHASASALARLFPILRPTAHRIVFLQRDL